MKKAERRKKWKNKMRSRRVRAAETVEEKLARVKKESARTKERRQSIRSVRVAANTAAAKWRADPKNKDKQREQNRRKSERRKAKVEEQARTTQTEHHDPDVVAAIAEIEQTMQLGGFGAVQGVLDGDIAVYYGRTQRLRENVEKEAMRFLVEDRYPVLSVPLVRVKGQDGVMRREFHRTLRPTEVWGVLGFEWKPLWQKFGKFGKFARFLEKGLQQAAKDAGLMPLLNRNLTGRGPKWLERALYTIFATFAPEGPLRAMIEEGKLSLNAPRTPDNADWFHRCSVGSKFRTKKKLYKFLADHNVIDEDDDSMTYEELKSLAWASEEFAMNFVGKLEEGETAEYIHVPF